MGIFGKSKTAGDKARDITIAETSGRKILFEIAGNNRYLVITPTYFLLVLSVFHQVHLAEKR